jgi:hypothetical protein
MHVGLVVLLLTAFTSCCTQGLVLGHGGLTLQKVQRQSGCKIEIHDSLGNLKGAHPDVNSPELHALIIADTQVGSLAVEPTGHVSYLYAY